MNIRWAIWNALVNRKRYRAGESWYAITISPFITLKCKQCSTGGRKITKKFISHWDANPNKNLGGWITGVICRKCHNTLCGKKHRDTRFLACTAKRGV